MGDFDAGQGEERMKSRMKTRGWRLWCVMMGALLAVLPVTGAAWAQSTVATTTVTGTVYQANGNAAQGSLLIHWPAFETAAGQAVAAGTLSVSVGADGFATVNLAPNQGATPEGMYYTVVYHLAGQPVSTEYWVVPAAGMATIASVRAEIEPAMEAVQTVSKSYVDNLVAGIVPTAGNFLGLAGGTLSGQLALPGDPQSAADAADKHYVDGQVATALPLAGGDVTGTLQVANTEEKLPRVDVRNSDFAGGADPTGQRDSTAALQAAIAFALASSPSGETTYPVVYLPPGTYKVAGTLRIPNALQLEGDAKEGTFLQETDPKASLIVVYGIPVCSTAMCFGGVDNLTLEGSGKTTAGALLEIDTAFLTLRNLMFENTGGRGLQMNGASERITGYDLVFDSVRWPMILAGDSNEDYFFNTQVIAAGQTRDTASSAPLVGDYCYSVNCTNGQYVAQGTTANPKTIYPDPHGAIDIDKGDNVSFIGGSVKSSYMLSGVHVWSGILVRFQNFYHESVYYNGLLPAINRAYIIGGQGEQTYFAGTLGGSATSVQVNDGSWIPQAFGQASDATVSDGDYFPYVILPQDYNRASTAASVYVSGLLQDQYEIVNAEGVTPDGVLHIQPNGRDVGGTAPAGIQWPAGSVIEEIAQNGGASVELDDIHLNEVQGPVTGNGWTAGCNETNVDACGEIELGYSPDIEAPTGTPSTNQVGFYAQLDDPNDQAGGLGAELTLRNAEMFNSSGNPYMGMIVGEHRAILHIEGKANPEKQEGVNTLIPSALGDQMDLSQLTGGSTVLAPLYPDGAVADVRAAMPNSGEVWDTYHGAMYKQSAVFEPNLQYGAWMNGLQFQNLYCLFDTPVTDGGHIQNRFCNSGGPSNEQGAGSGFGPGLEYDSWNGTHWTALFRILEQSSNWMMQTSIPASFASTLSVSGSTTLSGGVAVSGPINAVGAVNVAGTLTASTLNGMITVDGTSYKTLNAAWAAAAAQAISTGRNQTIWLAPGNYAVSATMNEPVNGACVSVVGSTGATTGADVGTTGTVLTVSSSLKGDVFFLGNAVLTEGCTFKDLTIDAATNATHGFELQWARGLLLDTVSVNDTTAEGILLGEETTASSHQTNAVLRNVVVSYASSAFTPATRPQWGIHLQKTAMDSVLHTITVRNALTAAVWNEGTGNLGYAIHGFGYPYTCTTAPCSNTATSSTAANASYASDYVVYDTGGAGSTWTDTYADSPAISAFYVGANGVEIHGGHVQWPDLTSFSSANLATVTGAVTNNLLIGDVDCLGMSSSVNWINYQSASGVPPTFASVHHLTGCGNYYQALEPATTTGFSGGGASNNAPGNGAVAAVWAAPKAPASTYSAFSAQEYTGYQGDLFDGHIAGQMPFFNITYQGTIRSAGGLALSTVLNTASTLALTTGSRNVIANAAGGAETLTLPSCFTPMPDKASPTGLELVVIKSDASTNAVTLTTLSGQTIDYQGSTAASLVIASAGKRTLVCGPDNNWYAY
jgi:hypothetical protein